jgi:hypothetical protein
LGGATSLNISTQTEIPINFSVNSSDDTSLKITSGGTVCIGNDGSLSDDSKADNLVIGTTSGHNGITIFSGTDKTGNIYFGDTDTSGAGNREGTITYNHSDGTNANFMRFSTAGNNERLRIDGYGNVSIGGLQPVPTDAAYNKALLHIHQDQSGTYGSEIHLTNAATGSAAGNGMFISMWNDDDVYFTNQESDGKIKFKTGGNTDCLVLNDDGIIGIGTDEPNLGGGGDGIHIVSSGVPELHLTKTSQGTASNDGLIIQMNGTSANIINRESGTTKFYVGGASAGDIKLTITDDKVMFDADAKVGTDDEHDLGASGARWKDLFLSGNIRPAAGQGIDFQDQTHSSATGASNEDELLNHYEQGDWTPVLKKNGGDNADSSNGGTPDVRHGRYIRIGKLVWLSMYVRWNSGSNTEGQSGGWTMEGLPFSLQDDDPGSCRIYQFGIGGYFTVDSNAYAHGHDHRWQVNTNTFLTLYSDLSAANLSWDSGQFECAMTGTFMLHE